VVSIENSLPHRKSIRLPDYDYTQAGGYFVTMVSYKRICLFGEVVGGHMILIYSNSSLRAFFAKQSRFRIFAWPISSRNGTKCERLSSIGVIVKACWLETPAHFLNSSLDDFVVMPNHIHGIKFINETQVGATHASPLRNGLDPHNPLPPRYPRGPAPASLSAIIGSFKPSVSRLVHAFPGMKGIMVWQRNYYEHVIRNEDDLLAIRQYIADNTLQWHLDRENPQSDN
jgi:REP element-mobilizing transposase RayT